MMHSFYELLKYAKTGIASPSMTGYDKLKALAMAGGIPVSTLSGIPPISFKSDGTPLTAWSMKGNGSQTGTPTPDAPIMPEFVGVRTAQLFDYSAITTGYRIQWASGEPYADAAAIMSDYISVTEGDYALNISSIIVGYAADKSYIGVYRPEKTWEKRNSNLVSAFTVLSNTNVKYIRLLTYGAYDPITNTLMLNTGSTALPYEPFGYKIPITCAGQTVPVYLGQTQTVRRVRKLVLTGLESITYSVVSGHSRFAIDNQYQTADYTIGLCSHYNYQYANQNHNIYHGSANSSKIIYIIDDNYTSAEGFKSYLAAQYAAGTPVTIWYVLATPETGIVNEPLCKIGDYADELSSTDVAVTIPTVKGQNTLTIGTTLQPSSVSITGHIKS